MTYPAIITDYQAEVLKLLDGEKNGQWVGLPELMNLYLRDENTAEELQKLIHHGLVHYLAKAGVAKINYHGIAALEHHLNPPPKPEPEPEVEPA